MVGYASLSELTSTSSANAVEHAAEALVGIPPSPGASQVARIPLGRFTQQRVHAVAFEDPDEPVHQLLIVLVREPLKHFHARQNREEPLDFLRNTPRALAARPYRSATSLTDRANVVLKSSAFTLSSGIRGSDGQFCRILNARGQDNE